MVVKNEDEYNEGTYLPDNLTELIQKAVDWAKEKEIRATNYGINDYDHNYRPEEDQEQTSFSSFTSINGGKRRKSKTKKTKLKKTKKSMKKK